VRRGPALAALTALLIVLATAATASAGSYPPYKGSMAFQAIQGPTDPEDYSWEVRLDDDQALRAIDERSAEVYWTEDETRAFLIEATLAHDAEGTNVPTTLAVSEGNVITLTVHHRAGDPAAGGAPFVYPVVGGAGWEGGFETVIVTMPPVTEQPPQPSAEDEQCVVPGLLGRTLKAARKKLRNAGCKLGPVRGARVKGARVVKQYRKPGRELPARSAVGVKLGL
jgi:hypothetical protein